MGYKRFTKTFVWPYLLLLILSAVFLYALIIAQWYITAALLLIPIISILIFLSKKLDSTNRMLREVFRQTSSDDYLVQLNTRVKDGHLRNLHKEINSWLNKLREMKYQQEEARSLTLEIVEQLPLGVILLDGKLNVRLSNGYGHEFLNSRGDINSLLLKERAPHFLNHLPELRKAGSLELTLDKDGESQTWELEHRRFAVDHNEYELIISRNIQAQVERNQGKISEELMHVLTHEIMNSVSPVNSLIDTMELQLNAVDGSGSDIQLSKDAFHDIRTSAEIIKKRSKGLMDFVERYALLARLPRLEMQTIELDDFLAELKQLLDAEVKGEAVQLELLIVDSHMRLRADPQLLAQVIINLVRNSVEALEGVEGAKITIRFEKGDGYNYISVADNGAGVNSDIRDKIFLPFFTTRQRGSGIGLSLSRKIINAHNGRLFLRSLEHGSEFRVELVD